MEVTLRIVLFLIHPEVYPGWYIQQCTPGDIPRVVHTAVYTREATQGGITRRYTQGGYPGRYARYIPPCIYPMVHPVYTPMVHPVYTLWYTLVYPGICTTLVYPGVYTTRYIHHPGYTVVHLPPSSVPTTSSAVLGSRATRPWAQRGGIPWVKAQGGLSVLKGVMVGRKVCAVLLRFHEDKSRKIG